MSISWNKVWALFRKDVKDTGKNGNVILIALMPLLLTVLYRFMNIEGERMPSEFIVSVGLLMAVTLLPLSTMSMMIAEEKEKNTLRTLMLSNVSAVEFLLSKTLVIFLLMEIVGVLIYAVTGLPLAGLPRLMLVVGASSICMILFGALIGILSKNQMSTGMISAPFALVLLIPSIFAQISEGFASFARFLPTYAMLELIMAPDQGILMPVLVILAWTVLSALLFMAVYRRTQWD